MENVEYARAERSLIDLLQLAYSGELAAAHAYRGHWKSSRDPAERLRIQTIEQEEWHHRRMVGEMLDMEVRAAVIGRVLGALCHLVGWLLPMYGAGKLESRNIREYEAAARYARDCGRADWLECLLTMAEVEWEHESYFRNQVVTHWLGRRLPIWPKPPPKESIRAAFPPDGIDSMTRGPIHV